MPWPPIATIQLLLMWTCIPLHDHFQCHQLYYVASYIQLASYIMAFHIATSSVEYITMLSGHESFDLCYGHTIIAQEKINISVCVNCIPYINGAQEMGVHDRRASVT